MCHDVDAPFSSQLRVAVSDVTDVVARFVGVAQSTPIIEILSIAAGGCVPEPLSFFQ